MFWVTLISDTSAAAGATAFSEDLYDQLKQ